MSNNISASIIFTIVEQCIILLNVRLFGGKDPCRRLPGWSCDRKMRELIKKHLEGSTACQQLFEVASPPNRPLGSQKTSRFGRALCRQKNQGRSFSAPGGGCALRCISCPCPALLQHSAHLGHLCWKGAPPPLSSTLLLALLSIFFFSSYYLLFYSKQEQSQKKVSKNKQLKYEVMGHGTRFPRSKQTPIRPLGCCFSGVWFFFCLGFVRGN